MATRTKWGFASACSIIVGLFWGCGGSLGSETGGESHFLIECVDSCGSGLNCISGVCTRGCVVDEDSCTDLHPGAECTDATIEPGEVAVCDLACTNDVQCEALGANYGCEAGQCRGTSSVDPASGGSGGSTSGGGSGGTSTSGGTTNSTTGSGGGGGGEPVFPCPDEVVTDPIDVNASFVQEDALVMYVAHSGGCEVHEYGLCFESELGTTESPRFTGELRLIHDANDDPCEAYPSTTLRFDLRAYAEYIMDEQDVPGGIVSTPFGSYVFGELGCDDLQYAAGWQQHEASDQTLNLGCNAASDCLVVSDSLACYNGCGAMISAAGADVFTATQNHIETQICPAFEDNECPESSPSCAERGPLDCVEGRCVELSP